MGLRFVVEFPETIYGVSHLTRVFKFRRELRDCSGSSEPKVSALSWLRLPPNERFDQSLALSTA